MSLTVDALKSAVRERIALFNAGDLSKFADYIAPSCLSHFPGVPTLDAKGFLGLLAAFRHGFPDIHITIERQVAEGDTVITIWTGRGTHKGDLQGMPPTGKPIVLQGVTIDRFQGLAVVEHHEVFDQLSMLQQLGAVPAR